MNKNQVKGKLKQAKGEIQEDLGKAVDSKKTIAKGKINKGLGKAQEKFGDFQDQ